MDMKIQRYQNRIDLLTARGGNERIVAKLKRQIRLMEKKKNASNQGED